MRTTTLQRREMLAATAATGMALALPSVARADEPGGQPAWRLSITKYLESLARSDGGYGWDGQDRSHLTPTFAAIGCYKLLGVEPPNKAALAQFVRTHHPRELKKLEQEHRAFDWQQIQSLVWLGEDVTAFRDLVASWKAPLAYLRQYEQHGYPVFQEEVAAILARRLVGLPMSELPAAYLDYLRVRRRTNIGQHRNGSFNNTTADDGSDGHVLNTWWGLQALDALGQIDELKRETIGWLQACQVPGAGFTYQPKPEIGGVTDVAYTWAAVRSLALLGAKPTNPRECLEYLESLWSYDGGFGDSREWLSNPLATYYALDAMAALGEMATATWSPSRPTRRAALQEGLTVFSIQIESHGQGSPAEAVDLADALKIHLWGAKNAKPEWLARAQAIAARQQVAVKFFTANEEYGTWMEIPGMGTYSHMSDMIAPESAASASSLAGKGVVSWRQFQERRLTPLLQQRGRLIWQFGENEPLVRMLLDDSIQRGGFAAISTFHFGNPDFTNSEPFLMRYRGQIPFVALQDAHGVEPWWFADMTEGFRTLFLARQPTWDAWLEALKNNWVVAVRHDAVSGGKTWMHGMPEVVELVQKQQHDWQWWDNPSIARPLVSVVALTPADEFEVARPGAGVAIRVRAAWENTTQGLPKKPIAELVRLVVDGKPVQTEHVIRRRPNQAVEDDYYLYRWPDAPSGKYTATATVKRLGTGDEATRSIAFTV
jgi:prenyltransferase beta subunit